MGLRNINLINLTDPILCRFARASDKSSFTSIASPVDKEACSLDHTFLPANLYYGNA